MPNLNKVMLMGNLTRDPELRYLPNNMPVIGIGLAVNRRWKNQQGEPQEDVLFIDCEGFGRTAEVINQYMKKGQPLYVEGRLRLDQWTDKEGHPRSKMKVVIENFQFLGGNRSGEGPASGPAGGAMDSSPTPYTRPAPTSPRPATSAPAARPAPSPSPMGPPPDIDPHQPVAEEDIPF
jgi:single-strand DNA-binding protein